MIGGAPRRASVDDLATVVPSPLPSQLVARVAPHTNVWRRRLRVHPTTPGYEPACQTRPAPMATHHHTPGPDAHPLLRRCSPRRPRSLWRAALQFGSRLRMRSPACESRRSPTARRGSVPPARTTAEPDRTDRRARLDASHGSVRRWRDQEADSRRSPGTRRLRCSDARSHRLERSPTQ